MAELNEREQTIVNLINQLADVANDETTSKEAIDRILGQIKSTTAESVKAEMEKAKTITPPPRIKFPEDELTNGFKSAIAHDQEKMFSEFMQPQNGQKTNEMGLLFTRIREVKKPMKAHPTDAGIDFFVPDAKAWDDDFCKMVMEYSRNVVIDGKDGVWFEDGRLVVGVNAHVAIPSGIKTIIPQGFAMMMVNKSGVATKLKLDHSACLIDSEYRDELIFCFFNHNVEPVKIEPGMKITQGLIVPVINLNLQECLNCVYDEIGKETDRGGGFGSSGSH